MSVLGQTVWTRLDMGRKYLSRKEDRDAYIQELMAETDPNPFTDLVHKLKSRVSELEDENKKLNQQMFEIKLGADTLRYDFENQTKLYSLQKKEIESLRLKVKELESVKVVENTENNIEKIELKKRINQMHDALAEYLINFTNSESKREKLDKRNALMAKEISDFEKAIVIERSNLQKQRDNLESQISSLEKQVVDSKVV